MRYEDLENLPDEVQEVILNPDMAVRNGEIFDKYFMNRYQRDFILDMEGAIFLKQIDPIDLPSRLEDIYHAKFLDLRQLALDVAYNILWPLQEYLGNVDRLILRLGGKVPRLIRMQRTPLQNIQFPRSLSGGVKGLMTQYEEFKNLHLTNNKIVDKEGRLVPGTTDNWIKDYVHFLGAGHHTTLQRSKYLSDSYNIKSLSSAEMESLRNFLVSYDVDTVMDFEKNDDLLRVSLHTETEGDVADENVEEILNRYTDQVDQLAKDLLPANIIMSEAGGQVDKLVDVLWNALGTTDKIKVVSCLQVIQMQSNIVSTLSAHLRFKSILKRYVSVKYGRDVEVWADSSTDYDILLRIYLQLILEDKIGLTEDESVLYALFLSGINPGEEPPVYLDQKEGQLHWRELRVSNGSLVWAHQTN